MAEYMLKYADTRGQIHQQVAEAANEQELREKFSQQGFLIYSIKPRGELAALSAGISKRRKKIDLEKFIGRKAPKGLLHRTAEERIILSSGRLCRRSITFLSMRSCRESALRGTNAHSPITQSSLS